MGTVTALTRPEKREAVLTAARELAEEAAAHLVCPTKGSAAALHDALLAFTSARKALEDG